MMIKEIMGHWAETDRILDAIQKQMDDLRKQQNQLIQGQLQLRSEVAEVIIEHKLPQERFPMVIGAADGLYMINAELRGEGLTGSQSPRKTAIRDSLVIQRLHPLVEE